MASPNSLEYTIRTATEEDIPTITEIYTHHVLTGVATFETSPPSSAEMTRRYKDITDINMPYLVAVVDGVVVGYAYAGKHKERVAYDFTVDDSIFLDPKFTGLGIGRALLTRLIGECTGKWRQMVSIIADPEGRGAASVAIHRKMGFREVGILKSVGWKMGRWIDVGYYQRSLGEGCAVPPRE